MAGVPGLLQRFNLVWLTGLIALAYLASARLGLLLALEQANTSPVWPPTGVAIAAALYCGCRAAPGIFLGAFLAHLSAGTPLLAAVAIAGGNTLAAGIACQLIHRLACDYPFRTVLHSVVFVVSVALATMASATVGVGTLVQAGLVESARFSTLWPTC